jgi:hypothetical protein
VDDILLIRNDIPMVEVVKSSLRKSFSMKDLGEAAYILGMMIYRDRSRRLIRLSHDAYIDEILNQIIMQDSKKGFLPMSHGITLSKKQCHLEPNKQERMRVIPYASTIGSIMYAMICVWPDVSYALSAMSRYQSNYGDAHWTIAKSIIKYLRRTKEAFLVFGGEEELIVKGYSDASFQIDVDDSKSKDTVADSTKKAEYIAAFEATKEAVCIRIFISELSVVPSASSPMDLYCDNSGAIAQAKEPKVNKRSKHILRCYHLIHKIIGQGDVKVCKVHTEHNIVDPLSKPLSQPKHEAHMGSMGIRYLHE